MGSRLLARRTLAASAWLGAIGLRADALGRGSSGGLSPGLGAAALGAAFPASLGAGTGAAPRSLLTRQLAVAPRRVAG